MTIVHFTRLACEFFRQLCCSLFELFGALGAAFLLQAERQLWPQLFQLAGWLLLGSSAVMLLLPWQWHQRFARHTVPAIAPWLGCIGFVSLLLGSALFLALLQPLR
jgi:protein-S-isoprenylcysteine O-methyltransferase Ste14